MDKSFSIFNFEKKRPKEIKLKIDESNKFYINYPYVAILTDSDIPKLKFGYNSYILNIGPIITSFYFGTKFTYNIISFVDKPLSSKLIFDKENMDEESIKLIKYFSIKQKTLPNEYIQIYFDVPKIYTKKNCILKGHLEIKIEDIKLEPILVEFQFNVILLPFEIYFKIKNGRMFWNKNKLIF